MKNKLKKVTPLSLETKTVKNVSVQGLELYLLMPNGAEAVWLAPRQSITVPKEQISQQIETLHRRRVIKVY